VSKDQIVGKVVFVLRGQHAAATTFALRSLGPTASIKGAEGAPP
jgi:hypothetical protein